MKLILLTYVNRSGSTYLANSFSKHPEVLVCPEGESLMNELLVEPERPFVLNNKTREKFKEIFQNDPKLKWWGFSETDFNNLPETANNFETFIYLLNIYREKIKPDASIILFKAERLIHLFERLLQIETNHKLIYLSIIRDSRGVYASQKKTRNPDTGKWLSHNPVRTALIWNQHVKTAEYLRKSGKLFFIKYEDLITEYYTTFQKVLNHVNLSIKSTLNKSGDLFDRLPASHKGIHQQIDSPPIVGKCNEWQSLLNKKDMDILEQISGELLGKLGYIKNNSGNSRHHHIVISYYYFIYYYLKSINKIKFLLSLQ